MKSIKIIWDLIFVPKEIRKKRRKEKKEKKKHKKYLNFIKSEIHIPDSMYLCSKIVDDILYEIISIGVRNLEIGPHIMHGELNNGKTFSMWIQNLWYGWASSGQIDDLIWDGDNNHEAQMDDSYNRLCKKKNTKKIRCGPTVLGKSIFREYLLSIDPYMFYTHFLDSDISYKKSYDLTEFNRDIKLKTILNGSK